MRRITLCILPILLTVFSCTPADRVSEVIDGDTFRLDNGETVRLLGINTPEMNESGGDIAKDMMKGFVYGKTVRLVSDVTDRDDHDRLLRYVYVDDVCVNAEMVRLGCAEVRFYPPDTAHQEEFVSLEKIAVRNERGLWAFGVFQVPDTTGIQVAEEKTPVEPVEVISWKDAAQYYGQDKVVEGTIVASNNTGKVCFLNFHTNWRKYFTAVIFASDFKKFPAHPEDHYLNRKVRVSGLIKEYKGKPEIILKSPAQITIIR